MSQIPKWVIGTVISSIVKMGHRDRSFPNPHFGTSGPKIAQPAQSDMRTDLRASSICALRRRTCPLSTNRIENDRNGVLIAWQSSG
jgi:hypothetical protein